MHDPKTGLNTVAATLDVYQHDEEGLQSIAIDVNFKSNKWVYLYLPATAGHSGGRSVHPRGQRGQRARVREALRCARGPSDGCRLAQ